MVCLSCSSWCQRTAIIDCNTLPEDDSSLFIYLFICLFISYYYLFIYQLCFSIILLILAPRLIKKLCSTQLSMKFFLPINVKMGTIVVGILTFMSGKNDILGLSEPEKC